MEAPTIKTQALTELETKLHTAQTELQKLQNQQAEWESMGISSGGAWDALCEKIGLAEDKVFSISAEMDKLEASGEAFTNQTDTEGYQKAVVDLENANNEMTLLKAKEQEVLSKQQQVNTTGFEKLKASAGRALEKVKRLASGTAKAGKEFLKFGKFIAHPIKAIKNLVKDSNSANKGFSNLLRTMKQMVLSMAVFQVMYKGLEFLQSGLKNLAVYSKDYNKSMSEMMSSTAQLKNALAVAFEPILNAVIPILVQLINYVNTAANVISRFFAILGGKSTYTKAIKQNKDYAASLNKIGGAADKAKGSLAGFDDLDVLQKNDTSSGSGGGADAPDGSGFEQETVGEISDWAQDFKDAIDAGDWYGVGALVAEKLNEALANIPWEGIHEKARQIGTNIALTINGFIENADWTLVGSLVGNGLNTAIYFLQSFVTTLNWGGIGTAIYQSINGFIATVDWSALGYTIGEGMKGILTIIYTTLEGMDWQGLAIAVHDFLINVDWGGIVSGLCESIGALMGGIVTFVIELLAQFGQDLYDTYFDNGEYGIQGFLDGMWSLLCDIGKWIYDHMIFPLVNGVKTALGIHSPSTVFKEIGTFLMQGFLNGITEMVPKLLASFTNLKERIVNIFTMLKKSVFGVLNGFIGGIESMANGVINGINHMIALLNSLSFTIPDWVPGLGGKSFGLNLSTIGNISIPRLANGGITTGSTLANIGEAGREAVLPLERDTGWADIVADKLAARMPNYGAPAKIILELDGAEIARGELPYFNAEFARIGLNFELG